MRFRMTRGHLPARDNRWQPSGYYMYRQFNIHKFYVLPTQCIYVFFMDLRTNSDYFTRPGLATLWLEAVIPLNIFGPSIRDVIMNSIYIYI